VQDELPFLRNRASPDAMPLRPVGRAVAPERAGAAVNQRPERGGRSPAGQRRPRRRHRRSGPTGREDEVDGRCRVFDHGPDLVPVDRLGNRRSLVADEPGDTFQRKPLNLTAETRSCDAAPAAPNRADSARPPSSPCAPTRPSGSFSLPIISAARTSSTSGSGGTTAWPTTRPRSARRRPRGTPASRTPPSCWPPAGTGAMRRTTRWPGSRRRERPQRQWVQAGADRTSRSKALSCLNDQAERHLQATG
jgi:hypothetical protein